MHVSAFDPGLGVRLAEQEAEARRLDAQKDKTKMCESDPAAAKLLGKAHVPCMSINLQEISTCP